MIENCSKPKTVNVILNFKIAARKQLFAHCAARSDYILHFIAC